MKPAMEDSDLKSSFISGARQGEILFFVEGTVKQHGYEMCVDISQTTVFDKVSDMVQCAT